MKMNQESAANIQENLRHGIASTKLGTATMVGLANNRQYLLAAEVAASLCALYASMHHLLDDRTRGNNLVFHATDNTIERLMLKERANCLEFLRLEDEENETRPEAPSHPPLFD